MASKDYYSVLGVPKTASEKDVKRAYRKLAREHHPDRHPGDKKAEERFKEINEAYEVLGDAEKRRKYDQFGSRFQEWERMSGAPGGFGFGQQGGVRFEDLGDLESMMGGSGFSDIFSSLFGSGAGRGRRTTARVRGQDVEQNVEVSLEEAYRGARVTFEKNGKQLEVKVPPGVKTGSKIRVAGEGGPGAGNAPSGDLYLVVNVRPHPRFKREGDDLLLDLPVDLYAAVLGGEAQVPTLEGALSLKIPPETQDGRTFKLRGQGMPHLRDPQVHGDLLVKIRIRIPQNLSAEEKKLFAELARLRAR
ncbi:MAG TPA: DnaJ C-terminal domain-containing protein [Anaerolineae bacterium]|nr:DnaJ C-terminal domain-containing protein [Anaerolineae bacterium]